MSTEKNKLVIDRFLERFSANDVGGVLSLLNNAAIWKVMGREGGLPLSGEMDKIAIADLMNTVNNIFPKGMTLTPSGWTASGDRVAAEVESYGQRSDGTIYNNMYHFLFEIKDEQIITIREYMDTLHVKSVFIDN